MSERCVCCGAEVPEGRQVCGACEIEALMGYGELPGRRRRMVNTFNVGDKEIRTLGDFVGTLYEDARVLGIEINRPHYIMEGPTLHIDCEMFPRPLFQCLRDSDLPQIARVIFNDPATVVYWKDGTKTVVKAHNEPFDPEKGLAMAFMKKALGNKGNFNNTLKKWCGGNQDGKGTDG